MRVDGERAIGVSVSMEKGGHIIRMGKALDAEIADIRAGLPLGMSLVMMRMLLPGPVAHLAGLLVVVFKIIEPFERRYRRTEFAKRRRQAKIGKRRRAR